MNRKQKLQLYGIVKLFGYILGAIGTLFKMIWDLLTSFWNTPANKNPIIKPDVPNVPPNKPKRARPIFDILNDLLKKRKKD